WQHSYGTPYSF
nr:immunoglobulin light chain junction region [Macaca mulatta]